MNFDGMTKEELESDPDSQSVLTEALSQFYPTIKTSDVTITSITDVVTTTSIRARKLDATQVHVDFRIASTLASLGVTSRDQSAYDVAYDMLTSQLTTFVENDYNTAIENVATTNGVAVTMTVDSTSLDIGPVVINDDPGDDDDDDDDDQALDTGTLVGIIVGVVVGVAILIGAVFVWRKHYPPVRKDKMDAEFAEPYSAKDTQGLL